MNNVKKLGVAIIGAGWVSGEHIKVYLRNPNTEIRAICSRNEGKAHDKMNEYNFSCKFYLADEYDEVLEREDIDIIDICTPNNLHAQQTIKAAEAGKHVFIEKPMCTSLEEDRNVVVNVKKAKVKSMVGYVLRFNPLCERAKRLVENGNLGKIFYAECGYWHYIPESVNYWSWAKDKKIIGDNFLSAACHSVDMLRWLVGEVDEVSAFKDTFVRKDVPDEDTVVSILRFKNGALGKIFCGIGVKRPYVFPLVLLGQHGTLDNERLYLDDFPGFPEGWMWNKDYIAFPEHWTPSHGYIHPFVPEINYFVECILQDKEPIPNALDGARTDEVCWAILRAAEKKCVVKLPIIELQK